MSPGWREGERDNTQYNYKDYLAGGSKYTAPVKQEYTIFGENVNKKILQEQAQIKKQEEKQEEFKTASLMSSATPMLPSPPITPQANTQKIKSATPEIILFDNDAIPMEVMADLIFEDIGGQELLSVSRHDTVSGDFVSNSLIKNLTSINQNFSSLRLVNIQNTSDRYFANFGIKLESKIPYEGGGQSGENVYTDNNNIIIELINIEQDEQIEVQIGIDGTIYTIIFNGGAS